VSGAGISSAGTGAGRSCGAGAGESSGLGCAGGACSPSGAGAGAAEVAPDDAALADVEGVSVGVLDAVESLSPQAASNPDAAIATATPTTLPRVRYMKVLRLWPLARRDLRPRCLGPQTSQVFRGANT